MINPLKKIRSLTKSVSSYSKTGSSSHSSKRSNPIVRNLYRAVSGQALDVAVKPQLVGELPEISVKDGYLTFYVLTEYSRSNSILIDSLTKEHKLPPALVMVMDVESVQRGQQVNERAGMIFLHHPKSAYKNSLSPRLQRLVIAVKQNPHLKIHLVPVTIIWGRAPEKEDSLFKLLVADSWEEPSISKQLFNIGVMGRDTFVEFHQPLDLADMLVDLTVENSDVDSTTKTNPNITKNKALITSAEAIKGIALTIQEQLRVKLDNRRSSILGPDLSDKRNIIDKLLYTPAIKSAIEIESNASGDTLKQIREKARKYLDEIVTDYSYPVVQSFEYFLTWLWTRLYDGVEINNFERVRELATDHEVIYVPCHRSHIDYLLLGYIIYSQGLRIPYIAAGDNLNIPVLGSLLRSGGAFFMRRSFKNNPLYGAVFKEYMHSIVQRNTPIKYFIEGGRSRSGRLLPPKLGMISMTVQSHLRKAGKPIVFVPTYIGYERIMEGGTYIGELKGKPKESENLLSLLKTARKLERIFGTVHVNFGKPLYLDDFMEKFDVQVDCLPENTTDIELDKNIQNMIGNIGVKILQHINKAAVLNPISLLSLVLLSTPKMALDEDSCREQIALYQRIALALPYNEDTKVTDMSPTEIINYGIKLKLIERTSHLLGDMIKVANNQAPLLSYFRNNILHTSILVSFLSALIERNGRISRSRIEMIAEQMYPFLQTELFLQYPQRKIVATINRKLDMLIDEGVVVDLENNYVGNPIANGKKHQQLKFLATPISQSLERYIMTLTLLAQQGSGKLTAEQLIDLCYLLGQRLSVLYADDMPDAFDRALFKGFLDALIRLDYVQKDTERGILTFDQRINDIAEHAKYILMPDVMSTLEHIADLDDDEIKHVIHELTETKMRKAKKIRNKK